MANKVIITTIEFAKCIPEDWHKRRHYGKERKVQQVFTMLRPVWKSRTLKTNTKLRFKTNVKSVLLYRS
jgi:hypothetical protein